MKRSLIWVLTVVLALLGFGWWGFNKWGNAQSASQLFYVPNAGEGTISIVDPLQGKTVDTISLGTSQASHGIALSPDGKIVYSGTGFEGKTLVAIDTKTKKIHRQHQFKEGVHGIDITPDGKYLYVSLNAGLGTTGGGLAVVDAGTLQPKALVQTGEGSAHVAVTPDGSQVWAANVNGNTVAVVDTRTNQLVKTIPVGKMPNEVAVSPDGKWAFAANVESNSVTVINAKTYQTVKEMRVGEAPHGVAVSPNGREVWVANNKSNDVSVIDINTFQTIVSIPTGAYANHVAFSADGQWAYVTNRQSNDVAKIDTAKRQITARIAVGSEPHEISLEDSVVHVTGNGTVAPQNQQVSVGPQNNAPSSQNRTKTAQAGSVQIEVQRLLPEDLSSSQAPKGISASDFDKYEVFRIALTTHSGDLSSLPLNQNTFLVKENGEKMAPVNWVVTSKDSHHPQYLAVFSKAQTAQITLEIGGLGDKPLTLTWKTN